MLSTELHGGGQIRKIEKMEFINIRLKCQEKIIILSLGTDPRNNEKYYSKQIKVKCQSCQKMQKKKIHKTKATTERQDQRRGHISWDLWHRTGCSLKA